MGTGGRVMKCCKDSGILACQHHPNVVAGPDLQIAYFQNAHIVNCAGTVFEKDPNCGTYIEIHRQGREEIRRQVLADLPLEEQFLSGFRTAFLPTHRLCFGQHELWWVVRTRSVPFVQKVKEFSVTQPSCPKPAALKFTTTR